MGISDFQRKNASAEWKTGAAITAVVVIVAITAAASVIKSERANRPIVKTEPTAAKSGPEKNVSTREEVAAKKRSERSDPKADNNAEIAAEDEGKAELPEDDSEPALSADEAKAKAEWKLGMTRKWKDPVPPSISPVPKNSKDPDLIAVRKWLAENTPEGKWEEIRWWPKRFIRKAYDGEVAELARFIKNAKEKPDAPWPTSELPKMKLGDIQKWPWEMCKIKIRTKVDGKMLIAEPIFFFRDGKVRNSTEHIAAESIWTHDRYFLRDFPGDE